MEILPAKYLSSLSEAQRQALENRFWEAQGHNCFICEKEIGMVLHKNSLDLDHIEPISVGGKDGEVAVSYNAEDRELDKDMLNTILSWLIKQTRVNNQ